MCYSAEQIYHIIVYPFHVSVFFNKSGRSKNEHSEKLIV